MFTIYFYVTLYIFIADVEYNLVLISILFDEADVMTKM